MSTEIEKVNVKKVMTAREYALRAVEVHMDALMKLIADRAVRQLTEMGDGAVVGGAVHAAAALKLGYIEGVSPDGDLKRIKAQGWDPEELRPDGVWVGRDGSYIDVWLRAPNGAVSVVSIRLKKTSEMSKEEYAEYEKARGEVARTLKAEMFDALREEYSALADRYMDAVRERDMLAERLEECGCDGEDEEDDYGDGGGYGDEEDEG